VSEIRTLDDGVTPLPVAPGSTVSRRSLRSEDILQGAREVLIQHGTEVYRLRLTKAGKLILNK
jgi:hemin uptake protein HemP